MQSILMGLKKILFFKIFKSSKMSIHKLKILENLVVKQE